MNSNYSAGSRVLDMAEVSQRPAAASILIDDIAALPPWLEAQACASDTLKSYCERAKAPDTQVVYWCWIFSMYDGNSSSSRCRMSCGSSATVRATPLRLLGTENQVCHLSFGLTCHSEAIKGLDGAVEGTHAAAARTHGASNTQAPVPGRAQRAARDRL